MVYVRFVSSREVSVKWTVGAAKKIISIIFSRLGVSSSNITSQFVENGSFKVRSIFNIFTYQRIIIPPGWILQIVLFYSE